MWMRTILGTGFLSLALISCSGDAVEGNETDGATDGETDTDAGTGSDSDTTTTTSGDPCAGVDCGGAGQCTVSDGGPLCLCDDGTFDDTDPLDCNDGVGTASASGTTTSSSTSTAGTTSDSGGTTSDSGGTTSDSGGTSAGTTGDTSGGSTGGNTSGGGKGDGEPCNSNDECNSGFCYDAGGFGMTVPECQSECIGGFDFTSECDDDKDCCMGTCENGIGGPYCMQ